VSPAKKTAPSFASTSSSHEANAQISGSGRFESAMPLQNALRVANLNSHESIRTEIFLWVGNLKFRFPSGVRDTILLSLAPSRGEFSATRAASAWLPADFLRTRRGWAAAVKEGVVPFSSSYSPPCSPLQDVGRGHNTLRAGSLRQMETGRCDNPGQDTPMTVGFPPTISGSSFYQI
jgi:hypothetical protein